jgi:rubrerythrin
MTAAEFLELIDFAIEQEQEAVDFYTELAGKVRETHVRAVLHDFAHQERGHKAKLQAVRLRGSAEPALTSVVDLKISDYLTEVRPDPNLDYRSALVIAMQKEKAAYRLYQDLGRQCDDPELQEIFRFLAQEEAGHKLMFETEYDDLMSEN